MKKLFKYALLSATALMAVGMTSCGSDDNGGEPEGGGKFEGSVSDPTYKADAVLYKITGNRQIGSIELTESGNYIILPPNLRSAGNEKTAKSVFRKIGTRASASDGVFGTYTRNADGSYTLDDFGVMSYANGVIDLRLENGGSLTLNAQPQPRIAANTLNDRFCRTWYVTNCKEYAYDEDGNLLDTYEYTQDEIRDDFVQYVIVSSAGTFTQVDWDDEIDESGVWSWYDTATQVFNFRFYGDSYTGQEQVSFVDNRAYFYEEDSEYDDEYGYITYKAVITAEAR